jgi:hypothetical protein
MSLRPVIAGFDLHAMLRLLGRGDIALLESLQQEFDDRATFDDPAQTLAAHEILRRAVFEGPRWPDLEVEGEPHVMAAIVLASHGQSHLKTGSDIGKMSAFWNFIKEHHARIPSEARKFLFMFGRGRALFGRRIETAWSYYGYLTQLQTQKLHQALIALQADDPAFRGPEFMGGFLDDFIDWLARVEAAGKDLWFHCH